MAADSQSLSLLMKRKKILTRTRTCVMQAMIIVGFLQQVCTLNVNVKVNFPAEFIEFGYSMSSLNFDVINVLSSLCLFKGGYYSVLEFQFWLPTFICLLVMLDYCRSRKMNADEEDAGVFHVKFLVMTFFSLYPQSCIVFLSYLLCQKVDGKYYLMKDFREHCYDEKWTSYASIGIPGIVVYVMGTPVFFLAILYYMSKEGILHNAVNSDKFAFLFIHFKPDYWWFAIYTCLVKCTLCGIIMFIDKGSATQVAVTLFFAIIFCFVAMTTAPYKLIDLNAGAALTTSSMVLTLFASLLLKVKIYEVDGWDKGIMDGFLMGVNAITMIMYIYRFVRVQGNFLCENYFPEPCQQCFLAFNRIMGWREAAEAPEDAPPSNGEGMELLPMGGAKRANDFWESTFKVVS